jgi:hypothetical protein
VPPGFQGIISYFLPDEFGNIVYCFAVALQLKFNLFFDYNLVIPLIIVIPQKTSRLI